MNKWSVRRSEFGNWLVLDPSKNAKDIYPSGMWREAFKSAWKHAVLDGLGIAEVTA